MRQEIEKELDSLLNAHHFINENMPPILLADLEGIVFLILRILIAMLKRELKRLA